MASDIGRGFSVLAVLTAGSRVLGMLRDHVLARVLGAGVAMNAFSIAFSLPNLFRRLFGEGALTVAFIPVFTSMVEQKDERGAQRLANLAITLLVTLLGAVALLGEGGILLARALVDGPPKVTLTLGLAAVMLPFVISVCLVALIQGILNVRAHFTAPALAPILLNVFIIAGTVATAPLWGDDLNRRVYGVALSVLIAGIVQVAVQIPALRRHGFRFRPVWDTASPELRRVARLMLPMVLGLGVVQLNTFVDQLIAMGFSSYESDGGALVEHFTVWGRQVAYPLKQNAVSVMYYAQRLYQLPLGVFTIAIGTAIFPILARHAHHGDHPGLTGTLNRGLRLATFLALPCTVGMIIVVMPLVRAYLEHGRFTAQDTPDVAWMTVAYVTGLVSYSILHLVTRAFFARQEVLTPVKTAVAAAGLNFVLNVTLIWAIGIQGLAVSTVIAATGQAALLVWLLRRRVGRLGLRRYVASLWRCALATAAMGVAAWAAIDTVGRLALAPAGFWGDVVRLAAAVLVGAAVYVAAARLLRMPELADALPRRLSRP